jgi:hypothetical protein
MPRHFSSSNRLGRKIKHVPSSSVRDFVTAQPRDLLGSSHTRLPFKMGRQQGVPYIDKKKNSARDFVAAENWRMSQLEVSELASIV